MTDALVPDAGTPPERQVTRLEGLPGTESWKEPSSETLSVEEGDKTQVTLLAASGSTGYEWNVTENFGELPLEERYQVIDQGADGGAPMPSLGRYECTITIPHDMAPGRYDVVFAYFRTWEGPSDAVERFELNLEVVDPVE